MLLLETKSVENAQEQRAKLLSSQESLEALNDKFHPRHGDVLKQLTNLNSIISKLQV